jgi:Protein of unknown function (DUF3551)
MLRIILAGAVAFAALVLSLQPAGAAEAPWCAVTSGGDGDMHWDCHYRSIEECLPNVLAGNRGWCNPSPYFVPPARHPNSRRPMRLQ